jgi:hypothetical protein
MNDIDWKRLVVVTASHGERYLGFVSQEIEDPVAYLDSHATALTPIRLYQVRNLVSQIQPSSDAKGRVVIGRLLLLVPVDMMKGAMDSHRMIPSSWYFPVENGEDCQKRVREILKNAEDSELRASAVEAGLIVAAPGRPQ